jgi:hypothetical protein
MNPLIGVCLAVLAVTALVVLLVRRRRARS